MKRLLFVCVENSCRSQIAEALARIHGGDEIEAYSAGSHPSGQVNPKAIGSMKEIGYDLSAHDSKSLNDIPQLEYDFVATMGCGDECPYVQGETTRGLGDTRPKEPAAPDQFRETRDLIERKVKDVLANLK